jgi:hypothetical protein
MPTEIIQCPHCKKEIQLSEAVAHQMREQLTKEFQAKEMERERTFATREKQLIQQGEKKAQEQLGIELKDLRAQLGEKDSKLAEASKAELELRKKQRELETKQATLELDVARKVDSERGKIREEARKQAVEEQQFRLLEEKKLVSDLQKQIEILKQKAEQGSQQSQGEVLELEFESKLRSSFPHDDIVPVSTGARGADVLQKVRTPNGQECGVIIWETKRTQKWSNGWIAKLKEDQRANHADIAVLLTMVLPSEVKNFSPHEGIWVTNFACGIGLAAALRGGLLSIAQARRIESGKKEKMAVLYEYLSGTEFSQKIEAIVESFVTMKTDLDSERRAMERIWAKREKQIQRVLTNTASMYGDIQGVIGHAALPDIKTLQLGN